MKPKTRQPSELIPPLIFPASSRTEGRWLARLKQAGRIRRIGPRLYASVPPAEVVAAVRGSWTTIVATLFPGALVSHRTALEFRPSPAGEIFLTAGTNRVVTYPGLRLRFIRGPKPLDDDPKFLSGRCSSVPRALLENLATTHPASRSRVLPIEEVEQRLEQILHVERESGLNEIRDRARAIARQLGWKRELGRLDRLIGALLGTRSGEVVGTVARARVAREPYSTACLERLQVLFGELRRPIPDLPDAFAAPDHFRNKAFFDSYFSNYIEGTTFAIEEAEAIIFDNMIPAARPKDAHDIVGTYRIVSDQVEMRRTPRDFAELLSVLRARHATTMELRPEAEPGAFKSKPNRAGDTQFVDPEYVIGTLRKGFELQADLPVGMPRAIFVMYLVTDVHPFVDGNGRCARLMMNSELVHAGRSTIIIPTVYRDDYLQALRALTRRNRPELLVKMLVKAQAFSTREFSPYPAVLKDLTRRNWFRDADEARIID